ncbi:MAG: acyltransferase [Bacteroidia bacterium]|nr:acyltransferase [Bacteroidia bacterium]
MFDLQAPLCIEDNATLSHRVMLVTHTDAGESPLSSTKIPPTSGSVCIAAGAYLGVNVTVLQGVTIGKRAIVGAASLVRRDVAAETIVAGVPAKELGKS